MKKILLLMLVVGAYACSPSKKAEKKASAYDMSAQLDSAYIYKHLSVIAADSLQGRDTGSEGQKKAAKYITDHYKKWGVTPGMSDGSYLQPVELNTYQLNKMTYKVYKDTALVKTTVLDKENDPEMVQIYGQRVNFKAGAIFAGFGISDSDRGITPFDSIEVKGKWVVAFIDIPTVVDGDTLMNPRLNNNMRFREVIQMRGAKGMLLVTNDDGQFERNLPRTKGQLGKPGGLRLKYLDTDSSNDGFSYGLVRPGTAAMLLGFADTTAMLAYKDSLTSNLADFKAKDLEYEIEIEQEVEQMTVVSNNIVGIIEGSDPQLKDEYVILSAHYDHVGVGVPDSTGDTIYNGADDDGSGTVGIFGVAQALAQAKAAGVGPKRSVMILHVTGEEKGLLGSRYYSDHLTVDSSNIIANINVDMIGRIDYDYEKENNGDYVYIIGGSIISSAMDSMLTVANNKSTKIKLDMKYNDLEDPNQFYRRSDHWNFGRLGIPFSFFFNGVHDEYHKPGDSVDKIAFQAMAKRVQLVYTYTLELANMDGRPKVDNQEFIDKTQASPR